MYLKVIGIEKREGTIRENNFHWVNFDIYFTSEPKNDENIKGVIVKKSTIKNREIGNLNPFSWLGKKVELRYDDEKNLIGVDVE